MYFITKEEFKKDGSFKIPSLFSKNIANFRKNENGIVNMSGIISLKNINKNKNKSKSKDEYKKNVKTLSLYSLLKNDHNSRSILEPILKKLQSNEPISENNLLQIKKNIEPIKKRKEIDNEINSVFKDILLFNFLEEHEIQFIIKKYNSPILKNVIQNKILNWKILYNLSEERSILKDYIINIYKIIHENDGFNNNNILDKLLSNKEIKDIEEQYIPKLGIYNKNENNAISKEIYKSKHNIDYLYIYFYPNDKMNLFEQSVDKENNSCFKYSHIKGLEITDFFKNIIEKSKQTKIDFLEEILYYFYNFDYNIMELRDNIDKIYKIFNEEISKYDKYFQIDIYYIQTIMNFIKKIFKIKFKMKFKTQYFRSHQYIIELNEYGIKQILNLLKSYTRFGKLDHEYNIINKISNHKIDIIEVLELIIKDQIDNSLKLNNKEYNKFIGKIDELLKYKFNIPYKIDTIENDVKIFLNEIKINLNRNYVSCLFIKKNKNNINKKIIYLDEVPSKKKSLKFRKYRNNNTLLNIKHNYTISNKIDNIIKNIDKLLENNANSNYKTFLLNLRKKYTEKHTLNNNINFNNHYHNYLTIKSIIRKKNFKTK